MDRDRFETALDELIAAHDRKVCAQIDAAACRTSWDYRRMHQASDAFEATREAFLEEVFPSSVPPS